MAVKKAITRGAPASDAASAAVAVHGRDDRGRRRRVADAPPAAAAAVKEDASPAMHAPGAPVMGDTGASGTAAEATSPDGPTAAAGHRRRKPSMVNPLPPLEPCVCR